MTESYTTKYDLFVAWCKGAGRGSGVHYQALDATVNFEQWLTLQTMKLQEKNDD